MRVWEIMKILVRIILITTITLVFSTSSQATNKIITISSGEWPPFVSEKLKYHGVAARIISESFALQNIEVKYTWFPWKRSYNNIKMGYSDASAVWAVTEKRSKEMLFSDPVINNVIVLFFNNKKFSNWKSYDDLSGLIIGATNGYFNGDEFEKAEKNGLITVERTSIESNNFKKLLANRIDAVVAEIDTGYDILNRISAAEQIKSIVVSPKKVASFTTHLITSKKLDNGDDIIEKFNKGLKQLVDTGKLDQYIMESRNGLYQIN